MHKWLENKIFIRKTISVSAKLTADEWELYSDMDGAEAAAEELNKELEFAVRAYETREWVEKKMLSFMGMKEFREFGASDTEPRAVLADILDNIYG